MLLTCIAHIHLLVCKNGASRLKLTQYVLVLNAWNITLSQIFAWKVWFFSKSIYWLDYGGSGSLKQNSYRLSLICRIQRPPWEQILSHHNDAQVMPNNSMKQCYVHKFFVNKSRHGCVWNSQIHMTLHCFIWSTEH